MPTPTIPAGNLYMNATTYAGTSATQTVTNGSAGASFQPDFIWIKNRTGANDNNVYDSVRGSTSGYYYELLTNGTVAENYYSPGNYGMVSAINSNGFTVASSNSNWNLTNATGNNYVAWQWKAGGAAVTNTSGTISSQVSANTTSGFSIVTYTGTGSTGTVGHGLGVAPAMMIIKTRSAVNSWVVYHQSLGNTKAIYLNLTNAADTNSSFWNNTSPTSSVLTLGTDTTCNQNGTTYVAYCWTPIAGYSAFGSYTGNASADGPFVYLGFRPRFIMWKNSSAAEAWLIEDTARSTYNEVALELYPSSSSAEVAGSSRSPTQQFDYLSNGFKVRGAQSQTNGSGNTIIYMAFAENPLKFANAR